MADAPDDHLDSRLRGAFEPDPRVSARVADRALAAGAAARGRRWRQVAAVACPAAAVAALAAAVAFWPPRPSPGVEAPGAFLSGSFTEGLLVVSMPDGSVAITGGGARENRPEPGFGIVLVEGEPR